MSALNVSTVLMQMRDMANSMGKCTIEEKMHMHYRIDAFAPSIGLNGSIFSKSNIRENWHYHL